MEWVILETDNDTVEIIPDFGREHEIGPECWCGPECTQYKKLLVVHEVIQ